MTPKDDKQVKAIDKMFKEADAFLEEFVTDLQKRMKKLNVSSNHSETICEIITNHSYFVGVHLRRLLLNETPSKSETPFVNLVVASLDKSVELMDIVLKTRNVRVDIFNLKEGNVLTTFFKDLQVRIHTNEMGLKPLTVLNNNIDFTFNKHFYFPSKKEFSLELDVFKKKGEPVYAESLSELIESTLEYTKQGYDIDITEILFDLDKAKTSFDKKPKKNLYSRNFYVDRLDNKVKTDTRRWYGFGASINATYSDADLLQGSKSSFMEQKKLRQYRAPLRAAPAPDWLIVDDIGD